MGNKQNKETTSNLSEYDNITKDEVTIIQNTICSYGISFDSQQILTLDELIKIFNFNDIKYIQMFYNNILSTKQSQTISLVDILSFINECLGNSIKTHFKCSLYFITSINDSMTFEDIELKILLEFLYSIGNLLYSIEIPSVSFLNHLITSIHIRKDTNQIDTSKITFIQLFTWFSENFPVFLHLFPDYIKNRFLNQDILRNYILPHTRNSLDIMTTSSFQLLSMNNIQFQNEWTCLYSSTTHGLSSPILFQHIEGYSGNTLLLIETTENAIFGIYSTEPYSFKSSFYGNPSSFIICLYPYIRFYHKSNLSGARQNYQYMNVNGYSNPHGLGFGGTIESFRIWINDNMDECYTTLGGLTYERGPLQGDITKSEFSIQKVEVWGFGGNSALSKQQQYHNVKNDDIMKNRKLDKSKLLSDFDQEMFLGHTYEHRNKMEAREMN